MIRTEAAPCFSSPEDSFDGALTPEQELELADLIQCGQGAQAELEDLEAQAEELGQSNELTARSDKLRARVQAGKRAEHRLIEMNLSLSSDLARISMGLEPKTEVGTGVAPNLQWLSQLNLPRAELDARTQVAYVGLIQAAQNYSRDTTDREGNPLRFSAYASEAIAATLVQHIAEREGPIRFPPDIFRKIVASIHGDSQEEGFAAEQQGELEQFSNLLELPPLGALYVKEATDSNEPSPLPVTDIIPDHKSSRMLNGVELSIEVEKALKRLDPRQADILRRRVEYKLAELAKFYGISEQRVSQLEQNAKYRLINKGSSLSPVLLDLLKREEPEVQPVHFEGAMEPSTRHLGRASLYLLGPDDEDTQLSS